MPGPSPEKPPTAVLLVALLLACALALVACGSSSTTTTTTVASNANTGTGTSTGSAATTTTGSTTTGAAGSTQPKKTSSAHSGTTTTGATSTVKTSTAIAPPAPKSARTTSIQRCLEAHGIKPHSTGKAPTRAQVNAALGHCAARFGSRNPQQTSAVRRRLLAQPAYREALSRFTACMRKHGLPNFPEANTSGNGPLYPSGTIKPTSQVREAQKACIGELRVR